MRARPMGAGLVLTALLLPGVAVGQGGGGDEAAELRAGADRVARLAVAGDDARARALLDRLQALMNRRPGAAPIWMLAELAVLARASRDPRRAARWAEQTIALADRGGGRLVPTAAGAEELARITRVARARAALATGDLEAARRLIGLAPNPAGSSEPLCDGAVLATDLRILNRVPAGLAMALDLARADPDCRRAWLAAARLARADASIGKLATALGRAAARFPRDPAILTQYAWALIEAGQVVQAGPVIDRALAVPTLEIATLLELTHLLTFGKTSRARIERWRRRATEHPDDRVAALVAGIMLHYEGEYARSDELLQRAERALPDLARIAIYRSMNLFHLGRGAAAAAMIEAARKHTPTDPDVAYCYALIHTDRDPPRAIAALERYLRIKRISGEGFPPKIAKVRRMLADLRACSRADPPSACIRRRELIRAGWPIGAALLLLVLPAGLVIIARRRRSR